MAMNLQGVQSRYAYDALGRRVAVSSEWGTVGVHIVHYVSAGAQEIVKIRGSLSRYLSGEDIAAGAVEILGAPSSSLAEQSWQDQVLNGLLPSAQFRINFQPVHFTAPTGWSYGEGAAFAARTKQTRQKGHPNETKRTSM